jgi:Lar family restriction alleviation protein
MPWRKKVKPCPFCGAVPTIYNSVCRSPSGSSTFIRCPCGAEGPAQDNEEALQAAALDCWNKRTKPKRRAGGVA